VFAELAGDEQVPDAAHREPGRWVRLQRRDEQRQRVWFEFVVRIEAVHQRCARPAERDVAGDRGTLVGSVGRHADPRLPGGTASGQCVPGLGLRAVELDEPGPVRIALGPQRRPGEGQEPGVGGVDRGDHIHPHECSVPHHGHHGAWSGDGTNTSTKGPMDSTSISTELGRAASDSRELDRICEQVAEALIKENVTPPFEVRSADFAADPYLICADRYWRLRFLDRPTITTAGECARWLITHVATEYRGEVGQKWSLGYGFITRDSVESRGELAEATERIVREDDAAGDIAFFATLYHAGKLRSNFWFDELHQFLESSLLAIAAGRHREDPLFVALQAFAAFGSRAITVEHATTQLNRAWNASQRSRHVVDICLNALSAAVPFEGQGQLLRQRAEEAVAHYPQDDLFHFRLATGQHMCDQHDAALTSIDSALRLLPAVGNRGSHKLLQEQYLAKRDAIQEGRLRALWATEQQRRWERQESANTDLRQTMQSSTIRAVELIAIFTAAIAFTVGSLQITLNGELALGTESVSSSSLVPGLLSSRY
jgi:hypothetical protein